MAKRCKGVNFINWSSNQGARSTCLFHSNDLGSNLFMSNQEEGGVVYSRRLIPKAEDRRLIVYPACFKGGGGADLVSTGRGYLLSCVCVYRLLTQICVRL